MHRSWGCGAAYSARRRRKMLKCVCEDGARTASPDVKANPVNLSDQMPYSGTYCSSYQKVVLHVDVQEGAAVVQKKEERPEHHASGQPRCHGHRWRSRAQESACEACKPCSYVSEAGEELRSIMAYSIDEMLASEVAKPYVEDGGLKETAKFILEAKASGALDGVGRESDAVKKLAKALSEARGGVKKKALLVPLRLCLTASDHGPDMNVFFKMLALADEGVLIEVVSLDRRLELLKEKMDL